MSDGFKLFTRFVKSCQKKLTEKFQLLCTEENIEDNKDNFNIFCMTEFIEMTVDVQNQMIDFMESIGVENEFKEFMIDKIESIKVDDDLNQLLNGSGIKGIS